MKHEDTTRRIIGAAYKVHNTLGWGFLEGVYENALARELARDGLQVNQQRPISVYYEGDTVGEYVADLVVDDRVIVEAKAVSALEPVHEVQLVNYLKATGTEVGLLINFGREVDVRRKVFTP